jgi:hypothetical protein
MGNLFTYGENVVGDVSKRRWEVIRRLLPILLEYVNSAMVLEWGYEEARSVVVHREGAVVPDLPPMTAAPPPRGRFDLGTLLDDKADHFDEIFILDPGELARLWAWCDFLSERDGVFMLFAPLVTALRERTNTRGA